MTSSSSSVTHSLDIDFHNAGPAARICLSSDGSVTAAIDAVNNHETDSAVDHLQITASECSWNLYASVKSSKSVQTCNRAPFVQVDSEGQVIRVGSAIYLSASNPAEAPRVKVDIAKLSLYVDDMKKHGKYLFVSSRQHATTVPGPEEDSDDNIKPESKPKDVDKPGNTAEDKLATVNKSSAEGEGSKSIEPTKEKSSGDSDAESSDEGSDPFDNLPGSESEDASEENSADESWSEGSTEFESDTRIPELIPRRPRQSKPPKISNSDTDSDSNVSDQHSASDSSEDSDLDADHLVEGRNKGGRDFDYSEDAGTWQAMFVTDRAGPPSDEEEEDDDVIQYEGNQPDDLWDDYDSLGDYRAIDSDSEECSECGDGGACALPPKDASVVEAVATKKDAVVAEPIGTPLAQIYVYDTSELNEKGTPNRIFHFKRPTSQVLYASTPAVHPTKPLLVWPLGDGKVLFADYINNTYFVRRIFPSQFWSSHVSVSCRFSPDGKYLHMVALEKSGHPPKPMVRKKKTSAKTDPAMEEEKEEPATYDLIVSTYRMSSSKTTKAPPRLVGRIQHGLGELTALPYVEWKDGGEILVTAPQEKVCQIYRVDISSFASSGKGRASTTRGKMTIQDFTVDLTTQSPGQKTVSFSVPNGDGIRLVRLPIAFETTKIPYYRPEKSAEKGEESRSDGEVPSSNEGKVADSGVRVAGGDSDRTCTGYRVADVAAYNDGSGIRFIGA